MADTLPQSALSAYSRAVRKHWLAALLTWFTLAGAVFGGDLLGAFSWNVGFGLAILLAGLMVAQFRAWKDIQLDRDTVQRDLDLELQKPVSEIHAKELQRSIGRLTVSIEADQPTDFADWIASDSFLAHFGTWFVPILERQLVVELQEWNDCTHAIGNAEKVFKEKLSMEVTAWGLEQSPFTLSGVEARTCETTVERAHRGTLHRAFDFGWGQDRSRTTWHGNGTSLLQHGLTDDELRVGQDKIESFFQSVQEWTEAQDLSRTWSARQRLKEPLIRELTVMARRHDYYGRCDICVKPP